MGRKTARIKKEETAEAVEPTAAAAASTSAPASTAGASLFDVFAQSAAVFGKKAAYTQEPIVAVENVASKPEAEATSSALSDQKPDNNEEVSSRKKLKKKKKAKKSDQKEVQVEDGTVKSAGDEGASEHETNPPAVESTKPGDSKHTVFVGNVSLEATTQQLKHHFSSCGKVETVRLRFLPVAGTAVDQAGNQKLMMKVCANKKIFTDKRDFCHAYVTFTDESSVDAALKLNRTTFMGKIIRVDYENPKMDPLRSVFVGNLSFHITDEAVWKFFDKHLKTEEEPNPVENVRIIRDRTTGEGKGFGYVLVKSKALAAKALSLHEKKLETREIRVQVCGKRFKNKKGDDAKPKHEGRRASAGAASRIALKRQNRGDSSAEKSAAGDAKPMQSSWSKGKKSPAKTTSVNPVKARPGTKRSRNAAGLDSAKPKPKKPKHAARKARQAAEAKAQASK